MAAETYRQDGIRRDAAVGAAENGRDDQRVQQVDAVRELVDVDEEPGREEPDYVVWWNNIIKLSLIFEKFQDRSISKLQEIFNQVVGKF